MPMEDMITDVNVEKAHEFIELLKKLGRVKNEDGIFDPSDPLVFEPTCIKELLADFERFTLSIEDYEYFMDPSVCFEVPLWLSVPNLRFDQIEQIADDYCEHSPSLHVGVFDAYRESKSGPVLLVHKECDLYDATLESIQTFLEQFIDECETIQGTLWRAEVDAREERLARLRANELKQRSSGLQGILEELDSLVGLGPVKNMVKQLVAGQQNQTQRKSVGLKVQQMSPHLVFTGNPGTGKTTVARLVGRIYKELGLLEKGHVVETERAGLVAGFVGQTALKTREVCESALGGVLFIDEAYSITNDSGLSFGHECIQTLLTFMENHRGELAVVVAGYPAEMEKFLGSNPGLRSRFDTTIHFPDYKAAELEEIFQGLVKANDYAIGDIAMSKARTALRALPAKIGFANGRDVRKLFQQITMSQAARCVSNGLTDKSQLRQITTADVSPHVPARPKQKPDEVQEEVDWFRFGYV